MSGFGRLGVLISRFQTSGLSFRLWAEFRGAMCTFFFLDPQTCKGVSLRSVNSDSAFLGPQIF
jgi:hypothetical protein